MTWGTRFTAPTEKGAGTRNTKDWDAARTNYLKALTLPSAGDREAALADTFQTLGQVMHLVQDLAVPAHARNDFMSHLEYMDPQLTSPLRWFSNGFERFVRLHPALVDSIGALRPTAFTNPPVTRFWDVDQYSGANPSADATQGLAEYTNANFASQNTILTESLAPADPYAFPYPRQSSTDLAEVLAGRKAPEQVVAEDGSVDTGLYVSKVADGENIPHFLKAGGLTRLFFDSSPLRSILPSSLLPSTLQIDDVDHRDYAANLLPRAVGYSSGLLDYFFRGKLEVRRTAHPTTGEPSLRIVNRSPDPLGKDGVFTLYQDDDQGLRSPVPGASLTLEEPVPQDNEAAPLYLPLPADLPPNGLTLVYQGRLGQEENAVIGKVLTESRIERIYLDWRTNLWMLQTADQLYALPLQAVAGLSSRPANVWWGARDNQIVARTFAPGVITTDPFEALLFEIERPLGSAQVPTTGALTAQGDPVVALRLIQRIPLFEVLDTIALGTTVEFTEHLELTQYGVGVTVNTTCTWDEGYGSYRCSSTLGGESMAPLRTLRGAVTATFPLRLTPEQMRPDAARYIWQVQRLWADRSGRLIAVVQIQLAPLPWAESWRRFPLLAWSPSGPVESGYAAGMEARLEEPGVFVLALVDLTARRLLAKTSGDLIRIAKTQRRIQPSPTDSRYWPCYLDLRGETVYIGGYWDGQHMGPPYVVCQARSTLDSGRVVGSLPVEVGTRLDQLEGLWQARLAPLGLGEAVVQDRLPVPFFIRFNAAENALRVDRTVPSTLGPGLPSSWWNRLWWFGAAPGRLAFQADAGEWPPPASPAQAERMWLVQWDLEADTATAAYTDSGTRVAAAVSGNEHGVFLVNERDRSWRWVPWTGAPLIFSDRNPAEAWDYVALDATRLLNVRTGELHVLVPGLPPDPDSPPFAPGGARGDAYHIIGR